MSNFTHFLTLSLLLTTIVPIANSLDPDETQSNSASHQDSSCLTLRHFFLSHLSKIEVNEKLSRWQLLSGLSVNHHKSYMLISCRNLLVHFDHITCIALISSPEHNVQGELLLLSIVHRPVSGICQNFQTSALKQLAKFHGSW